MIESRPPKSFRQVVDVGCQTGNNRPHGQSRPLDSAGLDVPAPRGPLDRAHARGVGDGVRGLGADAAGAGRPRPRATAPRAALPPATSPRAARPGPAGVGGRPALQPLLPHTPHRAAQARGRRRAQAARRAAVLPAPRSLQAAVGDLARAEHVQRPLRADREDPPRARRRDLRRGHHHGAVRHLTRTRPRRTRIAVERQAAARSRQAARRGARRAFDRSRGDAPRRTRAAARPAPRGHADQGRPHEHRRDHARRHQRPRTAATRSSTPTSPTSRRSRTPSAGRSTTSSSPPSPSPSAATCATATSPPTVSC